MTISRIQCHHWTSCQASQSGFGSLHIKQRLGLTDEATVDLIRENPYMLSYLLQQIPGRNPDALAHAGIGDRLEEADLVEIRCSGCDYGHGKGVTAAIEPDERGQARAPVIHFESALASTPVPPGLSA